MERRKQGQRHLSKAAKRSKPMESKSATELTSAATQGLCMSSTMFQMDTPMSNVALDNGFATLSTSLTALAPNGMEKLSPDPIGTGATREQEATTNIYQAFMNQGWEDLPLDVTPRDVVSEIIETFRTSA